MKKTIIGTLALFSALTAASFAGAGNVAGQTQSYARRLLESTVSKLESMDDYRADFTLAYGETPAEKGVMYVKGERYRVETGSFVLICDGHYTYTIQDDEREVTVRSMSDPETAALGSVQQILRRFADTFDPRTDRREGSVQYLRLIPKTSDSPSQYVSIGIDTETGLPVRLEDTARDGARTVLTVVSLERDRGASPALYAFDAKDYEQKGYYIARP